MGHLVSWDGRAGGLGNFPTTGLAGHCGFFDLWCKHPKVAPFHCEATALWFLKGWKKDIRLGLPTGGIILQKLSSSLVGLLMAKFPSLLTLVSHPNQPGIFNPDVCFPLGISSTMAIIVSTNWEQEEQSGVKQILPLGTIGQPLVFCDCHLVFLYIPLLPTGRAIRQGPSLCATNSYFHDL